MGYVVRDLEAEIRRFLLTPEILAIVGPRQCGKTTLAENILAGLVNANKVSFDDVKKLRLFENDIDSFIALEVRGRDYLFIDEFQYAKNGGQKLKYIRDTEKTKIIISGSSAPELSIQSLKFLVGRILIFRLYPFSFREFVRSRDAALASVHESGNYGDDVRDRLNLLLDEYVVYGGYPRVALSKTTEEKEIVLRNIYSTFLLREVKEILGLSDNDRLETLLKALSLQTGNLLNYHELSALTGFSFNELKRNMRILEETFICNRTKGFFTNKRTELAKAPKIYFIDSGFRNVCIDNFSVQRPDLGALYENLVFSELVKKPGPPKFWRTKSGAEVDFVVEKNGVIPIEVKSMLSETTLTRSLQSFIEKYKPKTAFVLSRNFEGKKKTGACTVEFVPFVKFLGKPAG